MSRISPLTLKGIGYVISTIRVVLLAIVAHPPPCGQRN